MINISYSSKYRNKATDGYYFGDLDESDFKSDEIVIPTQEVEKVIDSIESDVNEIVSLIEDIKGLTEIEEVKEKLSALSEKLY